MFLIHYFSDLIIPVWCNRNIIIVKCARLIMRHAFVCTFDYPVKAHRVLWWDVRIALLTIQRPPCLLVGRTNNTISNVPQE